MHTLRNVRIGVWVSLLLALVLGIGMLSSIAESSQTLPPGPPAPVGPEHAGPGCTAGLNQHCGDTSIDGRLEIHPTSAFVPMAIYRAQNRTDCFRLIWNANDAASFGMAFDYMGSGCGGAFGVGDEASRKRLIQSNAAGTELYLMQDGGKVGIGTTAPTNILTVVQNSATDPIADAWTVYSSEAYKQDIRELTAEEYQEALEAVVGTRVVRFRYRGQGPEAKLKLGVLAEEAPAAIVAEGNAQAVSLSEYVSLLHAAMKAQQGQFEAQQALLVSNQAQIEQLQAELEQLEQELSQE